MRTTVSVNLDFTTEEIAQFLEDQARRAIYSTLDGVAHYLNHHLDPAASEFVGGAVQAAIQSALDGRRHRGGQPTSPDPTHGSRSESQPKTTPGGFQKMTECLTLEETPLADGCWVCHECNTHNNSQREQCRKCDHARCGAQEPAPDGASDPDDLPKDRAHDPARGARPAHR